MERILKEPRFDFLSDSSKAFLFAFDCEMEALGYHFGESIGDGYCWGRYMVIYRKRNVQSDQVYARVYLRDNDIVLRLFLNKIDKHRSYLEQAEPFILAPFTGKRGDCTHCHNEKDSTCKFRKSYTLFNRSIEKCNGITFEYFEPDIADIPSYIALFREFYPERRKTAN
ncbi:MAG TPA: hypothetical protein VN512_05880 [Clostridia bacterium]|nr:hypothetical protein [Clostridia bacterium]